jgi:hypothetical protein
LTAGGTAVCLRKHRQSGGQWGNRDAETGYRADRPWHHGAALALNIAEKGFPIAVWNRTGSVTDEFHFAGAGALAGRIVPTETLEGLVAAMARPGRSS